MFCELGLISGTFNKQSSTKALNSGLQSLALLSLGLGVSIIYFNTFIAGKSLLGASPSANSIAVIPKDHISAYRLYPLT
jgi:hypothetical protein